MSLSLLNQTTLDGASGQHLRMLAQRLAAYIPRTLARRILQDDPLLPGEAKPITAATMFADLSGFTGMAESLAIDGARGTEALSRTLLMTFTGLINVIHDAGGAVSHFHGDAMMCYFPDSDGRAASRALATAQFMQRLMHTQFAQTNAAQTETREGHFTLSLKIGVAYGRCLEMVIGADEHREFVLAGTAVDEAAAAQQQAEASQVVASAAVLRAANLPASEPFRVVAELPPVPNAQEGFFWEAYEPPALMRLISAVPAFISPALFERLQDRGSQSISEHRSVTSMFVQFEGIDFSQPLAGEELQRYYHWAWQMVQRYGGPNSRVNRVLTGDKGNQLHILFGAPIAPDAPEQALRCALAMQQKRPDFINGQRIGLTVGRVFAGAIGSLNRREYTVVGRMVNLSARLTQICPPDGIIVDAETAVRVQAQIACQPLSPVALKGHGEPVSIYQVVGEQTAVTQAQSRFQQWQQPPAGRDKELGQLFRRMTAALQGQGGLVAIRGSFGSGQMPFLAAGVRHWLEAGGRGLVGVCQQHTSDVTYAPWVSVWRDFFELNGEMTGEEHLDRVAAGVQQMTPHIPNGVNLWRELLGAPLRATAFLVDAPAMVRQMRLFKLVQQSIRVAVAERPLLIVLEDIHLADQASLDLLDALAQQAESLPLLLLVTYRSGTTFSFHTLSHPGSYQIELKDFTPQQARQLIQARLGTDQLPKSVEQRMGLRDRQGRESDVNPLFLEETLQLMLALDVVVVDQNKYGDGRIHIDEAKLAQVPVPDTIHTLLLSRLDQLPAVARSLLQTASVIGREFDLATLVAITPGVPRETAVLLLDELIELEVVQQLSSGMVSTYLFQHNLIHQVVYQSLTYARRQALHATIAELIIRLADDELMPTQYPILAYHFSQTNQVEDGFKYALAAAEEAVTQHNYRSAAEFYKQVAHYVEALGGKAGWKTAVSISVAWARILLRLGEFNQADILATQAMDRCLKYDGMDQTFALNNLLAEIRLHQARYTEVPTLTGKVINSLLPHTPLAELAQAHLLWGQSLAALADWTTATEKLALAETISRDLDHPELLVSALIRQAEVQNQQHQEGPALHSIQAALALLENVSDPKLLGQTVLMQAKILLRLGRANEALTVMETAVSSLRLAGTNGLAHGLTHRAAIHIYLGQFDAALADLQLAGKLFDEMDDVPGQLRLYLLWGYEYHGGLKDWRQARRRLVRVGQLLTAQAKDDGMVVQDGIRLWLGMGLVALNTKRWTQAESLLNRVMSAVASPHLTWWQPAAYYAWGMLLLARTETAHTGRETAVAEAQYFFQKGLQAVEAGGCPDERPLLLLQLGLTARELGDEKGAQWLKAAVRAAEHRARDADRQFVLQRVSSLTRIQADDRRTFR